MTENNLEEGSNPNNQVFKDAENQIKEVCEVLQREATRLRQEQEAIDAMSKKIDHVHLTPTINLNIGGRRFTTSLQTLTKDPDSMLAAMFSGKFEVKPSEDGAFFIDRDGIELYKITDKRGRGLLNVEAERFRCHIQSTEINHEHKSMSERLE